MPTKEYYQNNRKAVLEKNRQYKKKHKETVRSAKKRFAEKNAEKCREYRRKYRRLHENVYERVYLPLHPCAHKNGQVLLHRLIMEAHLGRTLLPTEVVHHINGDIKDNRIENLMLFSSGSEHRSWHSQRGDN